MHIDEIRGKVDVGIITIREDEFLAVLKRLQDRSPVTGGRQLYDFAQVTSRNGDKLGVAVARCLEQGQGDAQSVAGETIDDLNPPWLFLVGIAGGIPHREYSLGDVVLASRLNDFSVSAAIQDQPPEFNVGGGPMHPEVENLLKYLPALTEEIKGWNQRRSIGMQKPVVLIPAELSDLSYYGSADWKRSVQSSLQTNFPAGKRIRPPKSLISPMISTNTLDKDAALTRQWQQSARHTSAVEMELGGVYRAAHRGGQRDYRVVAIRGISDIVGFKRSGDWTTYACHSAAAFACVLLRSGMLQMVQSNRPPHAFAQVSPGHPRLERQQERDQPDAMPYFRIRLEEHNDRLRRELPETRQIKQDMDFSLLTNLRPVPKITLDVYGLSSSGTPVPPHRASCVYYYQANTTRFRPLVEGSQATFQLPKADGDVEIAILLAFQTPVEEVQVKILDEFKRDFRCSWRLDV